MFTTIHISDEITIDAIQKKFNATFPYLKLEFFAGPHKMGAPGARKKIKPSSATVGECRIKRHNGDMEIKGAMSVNELEKKFTSDFGLYVQVFRKSGKIWLETTITDSWTLSKQNSEGEALSQQVDREDIDREVAE